MFEESIKDSKLPPEYGGSGEYSVCLTLWGEIQDDTFVRFLEKINQETQAGLHTEDYLVLDLIRREQRIPAALKSRLPVLRNHRVVETVGYGKGTRYILSRRYCEFIGQKGTYTRTKGLDRETNKELLLKHLSGNGGTGTALAELKQVLPDLTHRQVQELLRELRQEMRAAVVGHGRAARWYPMSCQLHGQNDNAE